MKRLYLIFLLLPALLSASCTKDIVDNEGGVSDRGTVLIKGSVSVPQIADVAVSTRAMTAHENIINNISVLVVNEKGLFVGRKRASNIVQDAENPSLWTFDVALPELTAKTTLHVIANYESQFSDDFDAKNGGKEITEVIGSLYDHRADPNADDYTEFVMWGFVELPKGITANTRVALPLIRNVSKIYIKASAKVISEGLAEFSQLIVCNARFGGAVAPYPIPADMSEESIRAIDFATEPPADVPTGDYYSSEDVGAHENTMYVYPRRNRSGESSETTRDKVLFLIIKAKYKGVNNPYKDKYTYYRIDITQTETDPATGKKTFIPYEIVGNHCYSIVVNEVSGAGYLTMEEAIRNPSANNINVSIKRDPIGDVLDVVSNGQYKMGLSRKEVNYFHEPLTDDTDFVEVARVWGESLLSPDDVTVGTVPQLSEARAMLYNNPDGLILEDGLTEVDGEKQIHMERVDTDPKNPYYRIMIKRGACPAVGRRTAQISVRLGNLVRLITLTQSNNSDFDIPDVVYLGWKANAEVTIPIRVAVGTPSFTELTCSLAILNENIGFVSSKRSQDTFVLANENSESEVVMVANSAYYAQTEQMYREQKVTISAPGFNTKIVTVKQSKFLDGLYGSAIIGIYRGDDDTAIYTTSFGESEEAWTAEVTQGSDFIKLGIAGSKVAEDVSVGSFVTSQIGFDYRLMENTTGSDRFGKIVITYAKGNKHTLYVHQGFRDVPVFDGIRTTYWQSCNLKTLDVAGNRGLSVSPAYGGSMYKFGDMNYTPYNPTFPSWGVNYSTDPDRYPVYTAAWTQGGGVPANYYMWDPCPDGYRLPAQSEYFTLAVKVSGDQAGNTEFTNRPFVRIAWGRVNDADLTALRAGIMYVFEDAAGNLVNTLFFPASGVRSSSYYGGPGKNIRGDGKLIYGHYLGLDHLPEYNFGNQGGCYWYQLDSRPVDGKVPAVNMFHDPDNNIGLEPMQASAAGWHQVSTSDAMPVRCIKEAS